jgi:quercetin dioxygenase-like cupin family protein
MKQLAGWPQAKADRHATALLFDSAECRLVAFTLAPDQAVPVHSSTSTVVVNVLAGNGVFTGGDVEIVLKSGDCATYAPNEPHGMKAGAAELRFLAVITPGPAGIAK